MVAIEFGLDPSTIFTLIAVYVGYKVFAKVFKTLFGSIRPHVVPGNPSTPWKAIGKSAFELDLKETKQLNAEMRESFFLNKSVNLSKRREQLLALRRSITENKQGILDALKQDLNRPTFEAVMYDYLIVIREIDECVKHLEEWASPESVGFDILTAPATATFYKIPIGTVLIIDTWNYPFMLALAPLAAAIAAGCTVVVKPCMVSKASADLIAKMIHEYMDPEIVSCIGNTQPRDRHFTSALMECKWDHIFFTGSPSVGKVILKGAANHLTPCTLELGGKNPVLVGETANLDLAAKRIIWGRMMNGGQQCISPDFVCVVKSKANGLIERLDYWLKQFYKEDASASESLGRIVGDKQMTRVCNMLAQTNGEVVCGGKTDASTRFVEPTVVKLKGWDDPTIDEETFGPIIWILPVDSIQQAVEVVKRREKPLCLYLFSYDESEQEYVIHETDSGGVTVNGTLFHAGQAGFPFGGVGNSGMGGYHGKHGFELFTHKKPVLKKLWLPDGGLYSDLWLLYAPYQDFAVKFFELVLSIL